MLKVTDGSAVVLIMRWLASAWLCAWLGGCGGQLISEMKAEEALEMEAERAEEARRQAEEDRPDLEQLVTRGRFDLSCAAVAAVVLDRHNEGPPVLVGVEGCDKQVQYSRRLRAGLGGRTTRNTHWEKVHEPTLVTRVESR